MINDRRQVLLEGNRVWQDGELIEPPTPEGTSALFTRINDRGLAIGRIGQMSSAVPVAWRVGGGVTQLPTPDGSPYVEPVDVNDAGLILGNGESDAVLWRRGRVTTLDPLVAAGDLNDRGEVVGTTDGEPGEARLALWRRGELVHLAPGDDLMDIDNVTVNDRGQVVFLRDHVHPFVYQEGDVVDLAEAAGGTSAYALDVSDRGQIVGYVDGPAGKRPVLWTVPPPPGPGG